jgi:fructose-bisphosphate aldolase class I
MEAWCGGQQNLQAAQQAFYHRAKCNSAATLGRYSSDLEDKKPG